MTGDERIEFLRMTAGSRLSRLTALCHALAKPYTDFYTAEAPFDWYKNY
jgi:tagatose 1,6-diphosphate aldolase